MASRDIGGSIQAALQDLFAEKAVVEEAIHKLQSLLEDRAEPVPVESRFTARKAVASKRAPGRKKAVGKKKAGKNAADDEGSWTIAARNAASERMRKYWADRKKKGTAGGRKKKA